jgi:hypothetical protein
MQMNKVLPVVHKILHPQRHKVRHICICIRIDRQR